MSVPRHGPVVPGVAVVDGEQRAAAHPGDQVAPGQVTGQADLDPGPDRQVADRPPRRAPGELVGGGLGAGHLLTRPRLHQHDGEPARCDDLGHRAGHHVEPLVGEHQHVVEVGEAVGQRAAARGAEPAHGIRQAGRAVDDVDAGEPQVGASRGEVAEQLATSAADVDDVVGALAVGEPPEGVGEGRTERAVRRRREVTGRALRRRGRSRWVRRARRATPRARGPSRTARYPAGDV